MARTRPISGSWTKASLTSPEPRSADDVERAGGLTRRSVIAGAGLGTAMAICGIASETMANAGQATKSYGRVVLNGRPVTFAGRPVIARFPAL